MENRNPTVFGLWVVNKEVVSMKFLSKFFKKMLLIFVILMVLCFSLIAIYLNSGEATTAKVLETSRWIVGIGIFVLIWIFNTIRKNTNKMCYNKYGLRDMNQKK